MGGLCHVEPSGFLQFRPAFWSCQLDGARTALKFRSISWAKPAAVAPKEPRIELRVDTTVVLINVTVTDPLNRFVTGLEKENFRLFEDKAEQKVVHFASEDSPLSMGLGIRYQR